MAGLFGTEHIAGTANFQITHGNLEARAERRKLADGAEALLRDLTERLAMPIAQVRIRMARRTTDTAANLVQLRQTHIVCVLDDKRVRVRNVNAGFNNRGADQNINLAVRHLVHNLCNLFLTHFAVNDADSRIRKPLLPHVRTSLDGLHAVVQVVYLSAASQLTPDGIEQHAVVLLKHERLHRMAVLRRLLDGGHIADTGQRHVERARDRRCRQREYIHVFAHFLERFLVPDAEPLFLVHNEQTEILELDLFVEQLVRADNQIDRARLQLFEQRSLLRTGLVAR